MDILKTLPCGCPCSGHKLTCNVSDCSPLPSPSKPLINPNTYKLEQTLTSIAEKLRLDQLKNMEKHLAKQLEEIRIEINHYENKIE